MSKDSTAKDKKITPSKEEVVPKMEKKDPKMGVSRFLQLHRQNYLIESLLKAEYGNSIMRESEWEFKLKELLSEKITK